MAAMAPSCWIGVASRDHVLRGIAGGFCQLGHGKHAALKRLRPDDRLVYYSPRATLDVGNPVQAFTAIGVIAAREPYIVDMTADVTGWRRDVDWWPAEEAPIAPLIASLDFITDKTHWGYPFRRGAFQISDHDLRVIAKAMQVESRL